jgi:hypothetical protein
MWDDQRLLTAIAALPPEAFIEGPPEDAELVWRRLTRRMRGDGTTEPHGRPVADVIPLRSSRPAD